MAARSPAADAGDGDRGVRRHPGGGQARTPTRVRSRIRGGQDRRLRGPRRRHAEGRLVRGLGRPARRGQGADEAVRGQVPERHRRRPVPRLRELDQAGPARRRRRRPAGRLRRQPGLPARRRAREGGPDPAARQVRRGLRLGGLLHAGDAAAVLVERRRREVRRGQRCSASPRPASRSACSPTRRSSTPPAIDPADLKTFDDFQAALATPARVAAGRRAGDRARQQGPVRRDPPVGRHPGRLHARPGRPRLDLPPGRRDVRHRGQPQVAAGPQGVGGQGLPRPGRLVQRPQRRRGGDRVRQGRGRDDDRRQLERRDRARRPRGGRDLLQHAARARAATRSRSARPACRCTSPRSPRTRTSRRRTSTSSPGPTRARRWSTRRRSRRPRTRRPSPRTSSARTSRPAGTSSSSPAA